MTVMPLAKRGRGTANTLKGFAERLKTVPGQWTAYPFSFASPAAASMTVRKINKGTVSFPAGQFEATMSDYGLIVRYIGG